MGGGPDESRIVGLGSGLSCGWFLVSGSVVDMIAVTVAPATAANILALPSLMCHLLHRGFRNCILFVVDIIKNLCS